jgi:hypothetical protein
MYVCAPGVRMYMRRLDLSLFLCVQEGEVLVDRMLTSVEMQANALSMQVFKVPSNHNLCNCV